MHLNHNNNSIKKNLNWFYNRKQKVNILGSGQKPGPPFDLILIIQLLMTKIQIPKTNLYSVKLYAIVWIIDL